MGGIVTSELFGELCELLRIPSVSTGEPDREALRQAADLLTEKVRRAGGACEAVPTEGHPLVVGELSANTEDAPTVLIYGHYDVQSVGDRELWETDPFEPTVKDGRVYARGASDDKGNFWPLLYVACEMARAGELPVNVRVLVEGEEEAGSAPAMRWIVDDERGADACIVFDSGSLDPEEPAITIGARGVVAVDVQVTTAPRDLHSGIFGGSVRNALHELMGILDAVLPGPDGILRDELRAGVEPIPADEQSSWDRLPPGDLVLEFSGGVPLGPESGTRYYRQNAGEPSLDVNEVKAGEPRTIVPATARAHLTMRLAPGQDAAAMLATLERLMRDAASEGVAVETNVMEGAPAASFDSESPPLRIARQAFEAACGKPPVLFRLGATIPILAPIAERGIQTIVSGFATPNDAIHAPNESYPLRALELGAATSRELYTRLAGLPR